MTTSSAVLFLKIYCMPEAFGVERGVRKRSILSSILFLTIIDCIMRNATLNLPRGIKWTLISRSEDLDNANDLAVLSSKDAHLLDKTFRLHNYVKQTGLCIGHMKSMPGCTSTRQLLRLPHWMVHTRNKQSQLAKQDS